MARGTALAGARLLVTGGGSGLGRQLALQAAARGAQVTVWDRSSVRAQEVCEEVRRNGGVAVADAVDVTDRAAVRAAAQRTGPVDVLVNNAGIVGGDLLSEATDETIEQTFAVNTLALYWVTRAFLDGMRARDRGTVVTVASAAGLVGVARQTDYAASKAAAVTFDESLRAELRQEHSAVRTFVVCPYYLDTGMFAGARTRFPWLLPILPAPRVAARILDGVTAGRRRLVLPWFVRFVPLARMLPVPLFDRFVDFLGVHRSMRGVAFGEQSRGDLP